MELSESEEVRERISEGQAPVEVMAQLAAVSVRAYFADRRSNVDAQALSEWHAYVEDRCSEQYNELRQHMPEASRADLNANHDLLTLNGLRRGIKQVMSERYRSIQTSNRRSLPRPQLSMVSAQF